MRLKHFSISFGEQILKALADESRIRILNLILRNKELCTSDLEQVLDFTQTKTSRHLAYLRNAGLVTPRKLEVIGWGSSNGVNLARYNPAVLKQEKLNEVKALVKYDPSLFYFLSVGRLVHDKGMDELLLAS